MGSNKYNDKCCEINSENGCTIVWTKIMARFEEIEKALEQNRSSLPNSGTVLDANDVELKNKNPELKAGEITPKLSESEKAERDFLFGYRIEKIREVLAGTNKYKMVEDGIIAENCNLKEKIALQDRVLESQKRYIASLEKHFITLDEMIKWRDNMLAEANAIICKLSDVKTGLMQEETV